MNTSAVHYSSEPSWSRRCSIESILSIQGKETDFVRDSSDTEAFSEGQDVEYEPCTEPEDDAPFGDSSGESDNEIISTKVIEVSVRDEGDLEFADSELTDGISASDSEVDLCDYWKCAQCGASNNNPLYRYCEKCFKVRKNFFPPRPKRKHKRKLNERDESRPLSQNDHENQLPLKNSHEKDLPLSQGNVCSLSQGYDSNDKEIRTLSQDSGFGSQSLNEPIQSTSGLTQNNSSLSINLKRRADSADRKTKRIKVNNDSSDSNSEGEPVSPLVKTISDPALTVENVKVTKKVLSETAKEVDKDNNMCIVCLTEPKSGVFVHGRIAHICCCYKCAVKVWAKAKRCPVCNCKVSNVLRAVVM